MHKIILLYFDLFMQKSSFVKILIIEYSMAKVFIVVFLIFGTVFGAGFSSGNEIVVFFSRFGVLSYFYILLAGFLLFWIFYFFLTTKISRTVEASKFLNVLIFFISLVFCASMFAGVNDLFSYFPNWLFVVLVALLLGFCIIVTQKGVAGIERVNLVLMPFIAIVFLIILIFSLSVKSETSLQTNSWAGFLYSPLYVALNTSMSGFVVSQVGESLSKKQAFWISFVSSILIVAFLLLGNAVLQQNSDKFFSEMPFLEIVKENKFLFMLTYLVILVGCFTTLISLTVTLKTSIEKMVKKSWKASLIAVFSPFLISVLGFSEIISMLYPLCSVLGVFMLGCFLVKSICKKD